MPKGDLEEFGQVARGPNSRRRRDSPNLRGAPRKWLRPASALSRGGRIPPRRILVPTALQWTGAAAGTLCASGGVRLAPVFSNGRDIGKNPTVFLELRTCEPGQVQRLFGTFHFVTTRDPFCSFCLRLGRPFRVSGSLSLGSGRAASTPVCRWSHRLSSGRRPRAGASRS